MSSSCRSVDLHLRDNISVKLFNFIDFLSNLVCSDQFNNWSVVDLSSDSEDPGNDGKSSGGIRTIMLHCLVLLLLAFKNCIA